jgi:MFS family permease
MRKGTTEEHYKEKLLEHTPADMPQKKKIIPLVPLCLFVFFEYAVILYLAYNVGLLIPMHIMSMVTPDKKTYVLAVIGTISSVFILLSGVFTGMMSDRIQTIFGRRKPILALSTMLMTTTLATRSIMPLKRGEISIIFIYSILYFVGSIAMSSAITAYKALIPDLIHKSQIGLVSGMMGFCYTLAYITAISIFGLFFKSIPVYYTSSIVIGILLIASICLMLFLEEPKHHYSKSLIEIGKKEEVISENSETTRLYQSAPMKSQVKRSFFDIIIDLFKTNPLLHWNFFWVFVSRLSYNFGFFLIQGYMLYFFTDCFANDFTIPFWGHVVKTPIKANSLHSLCKFLSCLFSSIFCGILSDRVGRKPFIYLSAVFVGLSALGTAFTRSFSVVIALSLLMGLGFGSHHAVDIGLANDVLPDKRNTARDMSIWQTSLTLPHLIAPPIIGFLIGYCDSLFARNVLPPHFGYVLMFAACALCQLLSALSISFVHIRGKKDNFMRKNKKEECQEITAKP